MIRNERLSVVGTFCKPRASGDDPGEFPFKTVVIE